MIQTVDDAIDSIHHLVTSASVDITLPVSQLTAAPTTAYGFYLLQVTLLGLWMMPAVFSIQLHFWRFLAVRCAVLEDIWRRDVGQFITVG